MTRFPTKVLSLHVNEDGTLTLVVHARGLDNDDILAGVTTDPPVDIQQMEIHTSSDGKPLTLEFRVSSSAAPGAGEPITLMFEDRSS
jgi:hypothetical protein